MAWEWSHTPEAYENARLNLADLSTKNLRIIFAEWHAWGGESSSTSDFNKALYKDALKSATQIAGDILVDSIWERAEEHRTCDNGGFNAWVCPFGCHTVSFDREEVEAE